MSRLRLDFLWAAPETVEDPYRPPKLAQRGPWRPPQRKTQWPPDPNPASPKPERRFNRNEIVFGPAGSGEDDPPDAPEPRKWDGWEMNSMLRRLTGPKWRKPRW